MESGEQVPDLLWLTETCDGSLDDFLREEGIFEEAQAQAVKEVVAWLLRSQVA